MRRLTALALLVLFSCAKEKEFEEVGKENAVIKSKQIFSQISQAELENGKIDSSSAYIYVPSTVNTPRTVTASRPHWMGDPKVMKFDIQKDKIVALELERDERFSGNKANWKPVLSIPVEHKLFRCKENAQGECSNEEEEAGDEVAWEDKPLMELDVNEVEILETNFLPIQLDNLFFTCHKEVEKTVASAEITEDAINIVVDKQFKSNLMCLDTLNSLSDLTYTIRYHYSFVKISSIADKNYQRVLYPRKDENTFGFFSSNLINLDIDNNDTIDSETVMMNRFSPNKKEIVYYLNEAFYKERNKGILEATKKAVKSINDSFKLAGTDMKIVLKDGTGKAAEDIRNSFIVMVEDPQASGVIGYGPSVQNPLTGEIISAKTVMYLGTIKKFIQRTYEEMVEEALKKKKVSELGEIADENIQTLIASAPKLQREAQKAKALLKASRRVHLEKANKVSEVDPMIMAKIKEEVFSIHRTDKNTNVKEDMADFEKLSRHNAYHGELFNFNSAIGEITPQEVGLDELKPWADLTKDEKQKVLDVLLPKVWVPTLVHEIGHNLGLRHNFNGSEDKDNYYTKQELEAMGVEREKVTYSSVMDYSYSDINQLPVMGKYDIAALRFGYAREVELADGSMAKVKSTLASVEGELKNFQFCTDEHVAVNPGCNRFDEGTNLTEMAKHFVKAYEKAYETRYKRRQRRDFSLYGDIGHIGRAKFYMRSLRLFYEVYDRINGIYNGALPDQVWEQNEFLKDLKQAAIISGNFLIDVIKTPSLHCLIAPAANPYQIVAVIPIGDISFSDNITTCYDKENISLNEQYVVIGEGGKLINSTKSSDNDNPYLDQIDVRGIWIDKLVASKYLFAREMGSSIFDKYTSTYKDMPELKGKVEGLVESVLFDKVPTEVTFSTVYGQDVKVGQHFGMSKTHEIKKSIIGVVNKYFDLKEASNPFEQQFINIYKSEIVKSLRPFQKRQELLAYQVHEKASDVTSGEIITSLSTEVGNFYASENNTIALKLFENSEIIDVVGSLRNPLYGQIVYIDQENGIQLGETDILQLVEAKLTQLRSEEDPSGDTSGSGTDGDSGDNPEPNGPEKLDQFITMVAQAFNKQEAGNYIISVESVAKFRQGLVHENKEDLINTLYVML
jgi:hypothetical protein